MHADPAPDVVGDLLADVHRRWLRLDSGAVADYIPQLAGADRNDFGLALVSLDGHDYRAGSSATPFTLQSVAKPFVYGLVLAELGLDEVNRWVGCEPSGEAFNAISLDAVGRPANAMINAGAIAVTALVPAAHEEERIERILDCLSRFAGRRLELDEDVYRSESGTGHRNRALAYLMHGAGTLVGDPVGAVESYFRQCSVRATVADLAVMAATLAAGGRNPVTGEQVLPEPVTAQVLGLMATCGMYDWAGEWMVRVGLPAKSGVSGALVAASPGRFGLGVYSPPLDPFGSSVRGVAALTELSERFGLHLMRNAPTVAPTVTLSTTLAREPVERLPSAHPAAAHMTAAHPPRVHTRSAAEAAELRRHGGRIVLVAAQGVLDFTAAERVLHALGEHLPAEPGWMVLDLERVIAMEPVARVMLERTLSLLTERGHRVILVGTAPGEIPGRHAPTRAQALADAEDELLASL